MLDRGTTLVLACYAAGAALGLVVYLIYRAVKMSGDDEDTDLGRAPYRERFADMAFPWMRYSVIDSAKSPFHTIEVIDTKRPDLGTCALLNGEVQLCSRESSKYCEMAVHFPAQYMRDAGPRRVLILGGGDTCLLRQVLKYKSVTEVTVLELDEMWTRVNEKHFGGDRARDDARVTWRFGNIRAGVQELLGTRRHSFDFILMDTTETLDHNRELETVRFFTEVRNLLTLDGIMVKNGTRCESIMADVFAFTLTFGFDSIAHDGRYPFTMGGIADFRLKTISTGRWLAQEIMTEFYDPQHHYEYVPWRDTLRSSVQDHFLATSPPDAAAAGDPTPTSTPPVVPAVPAVRNQASSEAFVASAQLNSPAEQPQQPQAQQEYVRPVELRRGGR